MLRLTFEDFLRHLEEGPGPLTLREGVVENNREGLRLLRPAGVQQPGVDG